MRASEVPLRAALVTAAILCSAAVGSVPARAAGPPAPAPAPANDNRANAQVLRALPVSVNGTTIGATSETPNEPPSTCASGPLAGSVWYAITAPAAERIALQVAAGGKLDAVVDVYLSQRSQVQSVACDQTDPNGMAATSFMATAGATYLVRVAPLANSSPGAFTLDAFVPQKAATPPGPELPPAGAEGILDRVQNTTRAHSTTFQAGRSYRINLANETDPGCVSLSLYPPGTRSFDDAKPVLSIHCGGYRLFTPGPGASGRYSFLVTPAPNIRGPQRYHLQSAPAGPSATAPGRFIGNYAKVSGRLDGDRVDTLRLYSFDVVERSDLTLMLDAPDDAGFDLRLLNDRGRTVACTCGDTGPKTLEHRLSPGRFFAVVRAAGGSRGRFTLVRQSRTITRTTITIAGSRAGRAVPGQTVPIAVGVAPNQTGPVTVTIDRFDPVSGWQYFRTVGVRVTHGSGGRGFLPPASGRWRASASFLGTRTASPSATGHAVLVVGGALRQ
jgi:hypothetical protein